MLLEREIEEAREEIKAQSTANRDLFIQLQAKLESLSPVSSTSPVHHADSITAERTMESEAAPMQQVISEALLTPPAPTNAKLPARTVKSTSPSQRGNEGRVSQKLFTKDSGRQDDHLSDILSVNQ